MSDISDGILEVGGRNGEGLLDEIDCFQQPRPTDHEAVAGKFERVGRQRSLPSLVLSIPDLHGNEWWLIVLPLVDLVQVTINGHLDVFGRSRCIDDLPVSTPVDEFDWKCGFSL